MNDPALLLALTIMVALPTIAVITISGYIISSCALYRIACKRRIPHPWLAWVPVVKSWTFGKIVDDFELEKGSKIKIRIILLILALVTFAFFRVLSFTYDTSAIGKIALFIFYCLSVTDSPNVGSVYQALQIICLYIINKDIYPEKSIKYLVISLLVPLGFPICLLKISKKCEEKLSI